jgi:dipeptidyl aminopeptidase/acylaminoacyl peptidase
MLGFFSFQSMSQNNILRPETLWKIGRVGLECVSPDGTKAVYGVQRYDLSTNKSMRELYLLDLATGTSQLFVDSEFSASDAEFHPSGDRVGYLVEGHLWEKSLRLGAKPMLVAEVEMNGFHYAPNGEHILFTHDVKYDETTEERHPDLTLSKARVIDGLFYRHWKSWHDYKYSNVFVASYSNGRITDEPVNIMPEPFDSPLRPFGGMEQICWSPDSKWIAYTCRKLNGTAESQSTNSDIYLYDMASGNTLNFSEDLKGYDFDPVFSPDGHYLGWTSMETPGYEADRTRFMLLDTRTQKRVELTENWDYECNHPQWAPDSKSLYFISSNDFTYQLFSIDVASKGVRQVTRGTHNFTNFKVTKDRIVASRVSMSAPAEIYLVDPRSGATNRMTQVTADPWDGLKLGEVTRRTVKTKDGKDMNVWVILPPDFDAKASYPALLYCQGGPQSALSQFFSYRWNMQMMAAHGYVVVAPCRRGMPGAGEAWNDAIIGDYGGKPSDDLLSAIDAVAKEPWVDANRLGAVGASYGGYSVYWLAGHHNKRFKAFISHCGLFNLESFYGTTEENWFPHHDLEGAYWQNPTPKSYEKFSPHRYVQSWDTPIMVIHDELDFRVPLGEGMQAFQAAQLQGIPSRFLYFPDEGHWVSKAQNSVLWQREFFKWLDTYLK